MNSWSANSLVMLLFILIGGYFSASEIALVSLREGQVLRLAEQGKRGRAGARLREDPSRSTRAKAAEWLSRTATSGAAIGTAIRSNNNFSGCSPSRLGQSSIADGAHQLLGAGRSVQLGTETFEAGPSGGPLQPSRFGLAGQLQRGGQQHLGPRALVG